MEFQLDWGVPERTPVLGFKVSPEGRNMADQEYGVPGPVALNATENGWPTTAKGRKLSFVMFREETVIEKYRVMLLPAPSDTNALKE